MAYTDYRERTRKPIEDWDPDQFKATRYFIGPWADRYEFVRSKVGGSLRIGGDVLRIGAEEHPEIGGVYATDAKIRGKGAPSVNATSGMVQFDKAEIAIGYESLTGNQIPSPDEIGRIEIGWEPSQEVITNPEADTYKWAEGAESGKSLKTPIGTDVGVLDLHLAMANLPTNNLTTVWSLLGKINSGTFLGFAAGHVLFLTGGLNQTLVFDNFGGFETNFSVELIMRARQVHWNKLLHKSGNFYTVTRSDGSDWHEDDSFDPILLAFA